MRRERCLLLTLVCLLAWSDRAPAADLSQRFVYPDAAGKLVYDQDERGNRVVDFSHAGYKGGGVAIPDVPVRVVVEPRPGDSGPRVQAALDYVAGLPADKQGIRGAVLLKAGRHEVAGELRVTASGVVLRGQGPDRTVLIATGTDRRTLIRVLGKNDKAWVSRVPHRVDRYAPAGTRLLHLDNVDGLQVGDALQITHPSTKPWIAALGMNRFPSRDVGSWLDWQPGKLDVRWDRVITHINGNTVTLDAPLTMALDPAHGTSTVRVYTWPGRIRQVGIENLRCESAYDRKNPLDEQHAWGAISFEATEDAWVRQVTAAHFAGSTVAVWETCRAITVEDCTALHPVSEIGGYRRHTFYTSGQQTLFQRCKSEQGRHDFAVGYLAAGPNAFVECTATAAHHFSGPVESWATGVLYDNVTLDGGGLHLTNRETDGHGVGWAAANCVLWQCTAPVIVCRMPPTARNWAIGCWGQFVGDGHWRTLNEFVKPVSLYRAQLAERLGEQAMANLRTRPIPTATEKAASIDDLVSAKPQAASRAASPLTLQDGWLVRDGKLVAGARTNTVWWRGHVLPSRAARARNR